MNDNNVYVSRYARTEQCSLSKHVVFVGAFKPSTEKILFPFLTYKTRCFFIRQFSFRHSDPMTSMFSYSDCVYTTRFTDSHFMIEFEFEYLSVGAQKFKQIAFSVFVCVGYFNKSIPHTVAFAAAANTHSRKYMYTQWTLNLATITTTTIKIVSKVFFASTFTACAHVLLHVSLFDIINFVVFHFFVGLFRLESFSACFCRT